MEFAAFYLSSRVVCSASDGGETLVTDGVEESLPRNRRREVSFRCLLRAELNEPVRWPPDVD